MRPSYAAIVASSALLFYLFAVFTSLARADIQPKLNEIMPDPDGMDGSNEWVEIYNPEDWDLSNWTLTTSQYIYPLSEVDDFDVYDVLHFSGTPLRNDTDTITLKDGDGNVVDTYTYSNPEEGRSFARFPDGGEWGTVKPGTQGSANVAPSASPTPNVSPTPPASPSPTSEVSPTPEPTVTPSPTPEVSPSPVPSPTVVPSPSPSPSPSPEPTVSPSPSPSPTPTVSPSPSPSPTVSPSPSPTPAPSVSPSPTPIPSVSPSPSPSPTPGPAQCVQFNVHLSGDEEVPANDSDASGVATIKIQTGSNLLTYGMVVSSLSGDQTGAHIHGPAEIGEEADVLYALPTGDVISGSFTYDQSDEADFLDGLTYLNVHSEDFPGGEIRGQLDNGRDCDSGTPTPTVSPTPTPSVTPTPGVSPSPTVVPSPTPGSTNDPLAVPEVPNPPSSPFYTGVRWFLDLGSWLKYFWQ